MLTVKGNNLFYYTMESDTSHHLHEVDFLISSGDKICPLEVKSGNYKSHKSLDAFCDKFSNRVKDKYVVHTKDYRWNNSVKNEYAEPVSKLSAPILYVNSLCIDKADEEEIAKGGAVPFDGGTIKEEIASGKGGIIIVEC